MKKFYAVITVLLLAASISYAQTGASAGVNLGLPISEFGDISNPGFGVSVQLESFVAPKVSMYANLGLLLYSGKERSVSATQNTKVGHTAYPLMAGIKVDLISGLYVAVEGGVAYYQIKTSWTDNTAGGAVTTDVDRGEAKFGYGGGLGYLYPIMPTMDLDISAKYQTMQDKYNTVQIRAAVRFGL